MGSRHRWKIRFSPVKTAGASSFSRCENSSSSPRKVLQNQPQRCRDCRQARRALQSAIESGASSQSRPNFSAVCARVRRRDDRARSVRAAIVRSTAGPATRHRFRPASDLALARALTSFTVVAGTAMPCSISISGCFRTKCATSAPDASTTSIGAIKSLAVRGAPCIGVFGAYGVALLRRTIADERAFARGGAARPRGAPDGRQSWPGPSTAFSRAADPLEEARAIHDEQIAIDAAIADNGLELIRERRARSHALQHRALARRAAAARRSASSSPRTAAGRSRASSSTRRVRSCRARA